MEWLKFLRNSNFYKRTADNYTLAPCTIVFDSYGNKQAVYTEGQHCMYKLVGVYAPCDTGFER